MAIVCQSACTYGRFAHLVQSGLFGSQSVITRQVEPASSVRIIARFPPMKTFEWLFGSTMIAWLYQAWSCSTFRSSWSWVQLAACLQGPLLQSKPLESIPRLLQEPPPLVER